jgi:tetratricopeptide (TPR) repeat protein
MAGIIRRVVNRLILLLVLLGMLGIPVTPPPVGVLPPLWEEAGDLRGLKSFAAAVEVYEEIALLSPRDPEPLLAIGEIYLTQHRWPLAEDAFNRALAREGGNGRALAGLASARWEQGDRWRAVTLWETALAHRPDLPGVRVRLALAYLNLDRPTEAAATLRDELAETDNPVAHLYLAMMRALDGADGARRELAVIPDDGPAAAVAGRDYLLAALDEAEAAGSAAEAAKSLGLALVQIEEWGLARAALERALTLDPSDAEAMAYLGHAEAQLDRPAFAHLSAAVAAQADWPLGHYLLGLYYLKQEAYEFAAEEFRATLRLDADNAQAQVDLARAYIGLGQYLTAEEMLVKAVEAEPEDLSFHMALVHFYADHVFRVADRGLAAAQAAADLAPDDPHARDMLGWTYFLAGDARRALLHLDSALRLEPELVSAHYHLGVVRSVLGEEEAAHFAFLRSIDLDTGGFYRDRALKAVDSRR